MGPKIKTGYGILKMLVAGYGMKLSWWDRDSLLFVGRMWDILHLKAGCGSKRGASLYPSRQDLGLAKRTIEEIMTQ